jgi:hypothetical protein
LHHYLDPDFSQGLVHRQEQVDSLLKEFCIQQENYAKRARIGAVPVYKEDLGFERCGNLMRLQHLRSFLIELRQTRESAKQRVRYETDRETVHQELPLFAEVIQTAARVRRTWTPPSTWFTCRIKRACRKTSSMTWRGRGAVLSVLDSLQIRCIGA